MIKNDHQLEATLKRLCQLARIQAGIRTTATPTQFESMSAGYLSEIQKMYQEIIDYIGHPDERVDDAWTVETRDKAHAAG